jgi:hypothetical protein
MCPHFETLCSIFIGHVNKKNKYPIPVILLVHTTYDDGTDRVFQNVCTKNSDARKSPKRIKYKIE